MMPIKWDVFNHIDDEAEMVPVEEPVSEEYDKCEDCENCNEKVMQECGEVDGFCFEDCDEEPVDEECATCESYEDENSLADVLTDYIAQNGDMTMRDLFNEFPELKNYKFQNTREHKIIPVNDALDYWYDGFVNDDTISVLPEDATEDEFNSYIIRRQVESACDNCLNENTIDDTSNVDLFDVFEGCENDKCEEPIPEDDIKPMNEESDDLYNELFDESGKLLHI